MNKVSKKAAKKPKKDSVSEWNTVMRAPVMLEIGSVLHLPYNSEVGAGEPSSWKPVHNKYNSQDCTLIEILKRKNLRPFSSGEEECVKLKVLFADGFITEAMPDSFIFVSPPRKK